MIKVLFNGKIYLAKDHFAEALALKDGLILATGSSQELRKAYPEAQTLDLEGHTVLPGLNDSHLHFMQVAEARNQVNIEGVQSIEEMIQRCQNFMSENPHRVKKGLHAIGWNQDYFTDPKRLPDRHDLDQISTTIPVVLERVCGHIVASNTKAIEILGLDEHSPQYPDGEFLKEASGYPNGLFTANACNFVKEVVPDFSLAERRQMLVDTMEYLVSLGLTSIQSNDVGTTFMDGPAAFALYKDIYQKGEGRLRYRHQVCFNDLEAFKAYVSQGEFKSKDYPKDSWLSLGPLKLFKDGSLGARTALMRQGYADDPTNHGREWIKPQEMLKYCQIAQDHGIQVITHVIGDKAIEDTVNCYEKVIQGKGNKHRHSLVHCQITDKELIRRIAKSEIGVMAQPIFLDYDMTIVEERCGKELASTSYAFHSLKELGAHVAYGTDAPVESCNPFPNIYMAVTRKNRKGEPSQGFYPEECVSLTEAIDAYTKESAYLEFMEDKKGQLKPGFYADLVVLDQDIFTMDPMAIQDIKPLLTMVGGQIVYEKKGALSLRSNQ